jgi:hypothetical protein
MTVVFHGPARIAQFGVMRRSCRGQYGQDALPGRSDTYARRLLPVAIRAATAEGGTRYNANLQCPRLSH